MAMGSGGNWDYGVSGLRHSSVCSRDFFAAKVTAKYCSEGLLRGCCSRNEFCRNGIEFTTNDHNDDH